MEPNRPLAPSWRGPLATLSLAAALTACGNSVGIHGSSGPVPTGSCPTGAVDPATLAASAQSVSTKLGIDVHLAGADCPTSDVTCAAPTEDEGALAAAYLATIGDQLARYPASFLAAAGPVTIVLADDLHGSAASWEAGGITVPERRLIFLNVKNYCDDLQRQLTLHHEFFHVVDPWLFAPAQADSLAEDWVALNPPGFSYLDDYETAGDANALHPRDGFVTGYATTNPLEDRAETYAYGVVASMHASLVEWMGSDPYLAKKEQSLHTWMRSKWPDLGGFLDAADAGG